MNPLSNIFNSQNQSLEKIENLSQGIDFQEQKQRFSDLIKEALEKTNAIQNEASTLKTRFDSGDKSISLSDVMIASQKSSVVFSATLEARNKLVDAYKEIMSMSA